MTGTVTFVVDLDAAGSPPAADSVRQLLALIEGLQLQDPELDWRLRSVSTNSPLRAELEGFDRKGAVVPETQAAAAAEAAFGVLDALNDNEPSTALRRLSGADQKRLRGFLQPLRERSGSLRIIVAGRGERTVRSDQAQRALAVLTVAPRQRGPEYGSVEGQILAATTHYGAPALRVRTFLAGDEVLCVFEKDAAPQIGADHTLDEVWTGQRVLVAGRITFDASGAPHVMRADTLKVLPTQHITALDLARLASGGVAAAVEEWGNPH